MLDLENPTQTVLPRPFSLTPIVAVGFQASSARRKFLAPHLDLFDALFITKSTQYYGIAFDFVLRSRPKCLAATRTNKIDSPLVPRGARFSTSEMFALLKREWGIVLTRGQGEGETRGLADFTGTADSPRLPVTASPCHHRTPQCARRCSVSRVQKFAPR